MIYHHGEAVKHLDSTDFPVFHLRMHAWALAESVVETVKREIAKSRSCRLRLVTLLMEGLLRGFMPA